LPRGPWLKIVGLALAVLILFVGMMELRLAMRGFQPSSSDTPWSWVVQRERADRLGERALVLVGASRMLLDVDLDVLRRNTGLEPVQLAIDGSSFVPVLENLADDPGIRGTVLVAYTENAIAGTEGEDATATFIAQWRRRERAHHLPDYASSEAALTDWVHARLRSYADGARPITSLTKRIVAPWPTPQYLLVGSDRSWLADYSKVDMPAFYYGRVQRTLGEDVPVRGGMTWSDLDAEIRSRIDALPVADASRVDERLGRVAEMVRRIEARGGHVAFAAFPTDGLVRAIDAKRYPREMFADRLAATVKAKTIHFEDYPGLAGFKCPDGSHLDYRDRAAFTTQLVDVLGLRAVPALRQGL
jgi:hypothetical protein